MMSSTEQLQVSKQHESWGFLDSDTAWQLFVFSIMPYKWDKPFNLWSRMDLRCSPWARPS